MASRESPLAPQQRDELRAFIAALPKMLAGGAKDVDRLLIEFPFRAQRFGPVRLPEPRYPELYNPAMGDAVRKMLEHELRTGHKVTDLLFRK